MPRFTGGVENTAPLRLQLATNEVGTDGSTAVIVGWFAANTGTGGSASRPCFTRPSVPGTVGSLGPGGRGVSLTSNPRRTVPYSFGGPSESSNCLFFSSYTTPPSVPAVAEGPFNLPMRIQWLGSLEDGIVLLPDSAVLLYATATGNAWNGGLVWEEL